MSEHELTIRVADLDYGSKEYEFVVRAPWIRGALEDHDATTNGEDGHLSVRASKSGPDVIVSGDLVATLSTTCGRCLGPAQFTVKSKIQALFVPKAKLIPAKKGKKDEEYELSADEADMLAFDGENVVLDDLVRDELVLETPMIPLCSEDCAGIAPPPGSNPSVDAEEKPLDPRLAALLKFKNEV
ncbi:MAG: DUF177 domain-containing protein [Myxococcales bacterium]|nr:DUF177 domain-containing protein [Myxococcales bacterium]